MDLQKENNMTDHKETDDTEIEALREKAKSLGIPKYWFMKQETLEANIAEAEAQMNASVVEEKPEVVEPKRKKAPKMNVSGIRKDDRTELVEQLEREDPDSKYIFQAHGTTDAAIAAKGFERTGHTLKNDFLCRTDRDSYEEYLAARNESRLESMKKIDKAQVVFKGHEARPKPPPA